jgi:hypothetical protein
MKIRYCFLPFILISFVSGCYSQNNKKQPNNIIKNENISEEAIQENYTIDKSELIDRTIKEEPIEINDSFGLNGQIITNTDTNEELIIQRVFKYKYSAKDYKLTDNVNLYIEPNTNTISYSIPKGNEETLESSVLYVVYPHKKNEVQVWIKVTSSKGHEGWLFLGSQDPYQDDNWKYMGKITIGNKTYHLMKYSHWFSINRNEPAYDRPSLVDSKVLWKSERTNDNSQINLEPLLITNETYPGEYCDEHWVKVKDSYGRIGWFPGDKLDIERGGFKYLTPENISCYAFYEE